MVRKIGQVIGWTVALAMFAAGSWCVWYAFTQKLEVLSPLHLVAIAGATFVCAFLVLSGVASGKIGLGVRTGSIQEEPTWVLSVAAVIVALVISGALCAVLGGAIDARMRSETHLAKVVAALIVLEFLLVRILLRRRQDRLEREAERVRIGS